MAGISGLGVYGSIQERAKRLREIGMSPEQADQVAANPSLMPPLGTYDPALDAQMGQSQRGLQDLLDDYARDYGSGGWGEGRAGADYNLGVGSVNEMSQQQLDDLGLSTARGQEDYSRNLNRGEADIFRGSARGIADLVRDAGYQSFDVNRGTDRGIADLIRDSGWQIDDANRSMSRGWDDTNKNADRGIFDITRDSGRNLEDIMSNRSRAGEDYTSQLEGLQRQYDRMGNSQTQAARAQGVARGGALQQALAKRAENQAYDRKPIETGFRRFGEDSKRDETRVIENRDTGIGRIGEDRNTVLGRLGEDRDTTVGRTSALRDTGVTRMGEDRNTALERITTGRDTGIGRYNEDAHLGVNRLHEDTDLGLGRLNEDSIRGALRIGSARDTQLGQLGLNYGRSLADAGTASTRAQREGTQFGLDVGNTARYQAIQSGQYVPPPFPTAPAAKAPAASSKPVALWGGSGAGVTELSPFASRRNLAQRWGASNSGSFSSYF